LLLALVLDEAVGGSRWVCCAASGARFVCACGATGQERDRVVRAAGDV